ncbi:MAG: anthranilate phosphoribosyltransferase [Rhodospirillaceae bacterium]|nr:anthranilate phosphoribosyltransferase [Rhodospirillaceae bacterium]|tara:strand:- start:3960 stop:4991 length:1032 start_codon:yes stop_codon:yes gene_type:complete
MSDYIADLKELIAVVAEGTSLTEKQSQEAFEIIMSGDASPSQIGGFLMAMRVRGETVAEITGAARTMRAKVTSIKAPENAIDTVGTGGDSSGTYNISTASSFIVSAAGVPVAKHGNKALSSKTGAADVLTQLGVNLDCDMSLVQKAMDELGICFLMAPRHHTAMRHVATSRLELGTRTIFNLLGPLANPAKVKRQLVGVFAESWVEPIAHVLKSLGSERAWVVHGSDGLDEITTTGSTKVASLDGNLVTTFHIHPSDIGLSIAKPEALKGGFPHQNASALLELLDGKKSEYRDIVILNSAASLVIANHVDNLLDGAAIANNMIDSGKAKEKLNQLIKITNLSG